MTAGAPPGWEGILGRGEEILWQGRPDTRLRPVGPWPQTLMGVFVTGFSIFWITMAAAMSPPGFDLFPLFGLPFLAIGLWAAGLRWVWDAWLRGRTWYTLTTERAFIARDLLGQKSLKSWSIGPDTVLDLDMGPPDTVWFAETWRSHGKGSTRQRIGFRFIEDGRAVYGLMRRARATAEG
ncbi:aspartate carbamoyltransferase catalytic subunit [Rhodobacteraceae bacterium CCMM004]|nr:aspartate carbamoyltransferase catalytic subunit [Rhodobacteraceae bacterium CCMM004]